MLAPLPCATLWPELEVFFNYCKTSSPSGVLATALDAVGVPHQRPNKLPLRALFPMGGRRNTESSVL